VKPIELIVSAIVVLACIAFFAFACWLGPASFV